jgi:hypothetical protein
LLDLINDILDFSKIEAGHIEMDEIDFSIHNIVSDLAAIIGPLASAKGNVVNTSIHETMHRAYRGDVPEIFEANSIRLYKAEDFPNKWTFVTTLVDNQELVDPSIAFFNDKWWMFATPTSNDTLHLFYADDLLGPWQEHPQSPLVEGNNHISRSSGRVLVYEDRLFRYTMDVDPPFGTHQIWAFEITDLSPTTYAEKLVSEEPILKASGSGWNAQAMHQIDPHQIAPNLWISSVDGFGKYFVFGLKY